MPQVIQKDRHGDNQDYRNNQDAGNHPGKNQEDDDDYDDEDQDHHKRPRKHDGLRRVWLDARGDVVNDSEELRNINERRIPRKMIQI